MYQKSKQPRQYALDGTVAPIDHSHRSWLSADQVAKLILPLGACQTFELMWTGVSVAGSPPMLMSKAVYYRPQIRQSFINL